MSLETVDLIPRKVLFGNPDRAGARLSPDGRRISFLAPVDGVLNVWVGPAGRPQDARAVTHDRVRGIRVYFWAFTNRHVVYLQDEGGDENWRVYATDISSGETRCLTPFEKVAARIQGVSPDHPDEILIGINNRVPELHDIQRVDIRTGEMTLVQENPGFAGFLTDDAFAVRFAVRMTPDGGQEMLSPSGGGDWDVFAVIGPEDAMTTDALGFDRSGRVLYLKDSRGRDTAALTRLNLDTGEQTVVAEHPAADVSDVLVHPTEKTLQAAAFAYERKEWRILDDDIAPDFACLKSVADGEFEVVSRTLEDDAWIVAYLRDAGPVRYYAYDRRNRAARFLFTNLQALEGLPLASMRPAVVASRDGLNLVSYYTLPPGSDPDGDGRPDNPLPTVLYVHGGPWARDEWGYDPVHQMLANRGYAVLSVNYRGSSGFGKAFINAGDMEWAGKMHDDLIDAVDWAIEQRIADPDRVAIMGGSYGGYATLVGMTFTPERFVCGVDIVGPSNLVTLIETIPPYWQPMIDLFANRVGDHTTEEGREFLRSRSPLTHVDRIRRPLLIGQGANDPRVKESESLQIVEAMQARGIPVTYVVYPDEGHGFARPENRLSFFAVAEAFLTGPLGGRCEPIGDDFDESTITVPVGAEIVPGLKEALAAKPE